MAKFQIVHVTPTDYDPDQNRENLQVLADELNRDAVSEGAVDRWIVVDESVVGDLFKIKTEH